MSTVRRAIVAGALALPLTLGTAGIASADTAYDADHSYAGVEGAGSYEVNSFAGDHESGDNGDDTDGYGGAYFEESWSHAGPDHAVLEFTGSGANEYGTTYMHERYTAGEDGAWSSDVHSIASTDVDDTE